MFRIFKDLRKNILSGGTTSRYFKYAMGEVFLIMVGILFALQINNWNENRKDREKETVFLQQLKEDFNKDLDQLKEKNAMREMIMKSMTSILVGNDNINATQRDSIHFYLSYGLAVPTFDPITSYLSRSESVIYINDEELKRKLINWTSDVLQLIDEEDTWVEFRNNYFAPFLVENHNLRDTYDTFWEFITSRRGLLEDNRKRDNFILGKSTKPIKNIFDSPELENHVSHIFTINKMASLQAETLESRINDILSLIDNNM